MTAWPEKEVMSIAITGAAGQIAYSLNALIIQGLMLGPHQKVELRLLDIEPSMKMLEAVEMELRDCAPPLLAGLVITTDPKVAFSGADVAIMCGAFPRKDGMERKDLLKLNAKIFKEQGRILKEVGSKHCRVLVVGNPANTNALLLASAAEGGLDPRNVTALTRLDHNRAIAMAAEKTGAAVKNVIIWGNHSGTQVPDVTFASTDDAKAAPIVGGLPNDDYFSGEFIPAVQQRGAAVIKKRGFSSAMSAAKAIVDHVRDWILGTSTGKWVSMAVWSTGNPYGVPEGLCFSFPCTCVKGEWTIVGGLSLTDAIKARIAATTQELQEEKQQAFEE